jgi:hypothetical protein
MAVSSQQLAQFPPEDFAGGIAWDGRDKFDGAGLFVVGEAVAHEGAEFFLQ